MRLEVVPDETGYPDHPREWDNAWTLVPCKKFRYPGLFDDTGVQVDWSDFTEYEDVDYKSLAKKTGERISIAVPIYIMEHGTITLSRKQFYNEDPCRWDWGIAGIAYMTTKVRKGFKKREDALKLLDDELETLTAYANGEAWEFRIYDDGGQQVSAVGGYYSEEEEEAEQAGKEELEYWEKRTPKQLALPLEV